MLWFNNGLDATPLAGSTSITTPLLIAGVIPPSYLHGLTILRMILRVVWAASEPTNVCNALAAVYVGTRGTAGLPPDLNADLANYYWFAGLQSVIVSVDPTATQVMERDIRSKRIIRGEDTDLFFRVTNNETSAMNVGFECRFLLQMR